MKAKAMVSALSAAFALSVGLGIPASAMAGDDDEKEITIIHIGDIHGHLIPRPNVRSDGSGRMEGGLARMYSKIQSIRKDNEKKNLLINTGDTIQGSAEALHTKGQALVDVLNLFKIDVFAPGNWEFVYGTDRFLELFVGDPANGIAPKAPWNTISANVHYTAEGGKYTDKAGQRVLPPYVIKTVNGVKVGVIGFTTDRGPQVVGSGVTRGFKFKNSLPGSAGIAGSDVSEVEAELQAQIAEVRPQVDLLIVASELGLANNIMLAERNAGIDLVLSSDMHEETRQPYVTQNGTLIVEEGQDGTMIGELEFAFRKDWRTGKLAIKEWDWKAHTIDDRLSSNDNVAKKVKAVRAPFVKGSYNPAKIEANIYSGRKPAGPIDEVVGYTTIPLHRTNFAQEGMPAVVEGSGHDFLTDAFRTVAIQQLGAEMDAGTRPSDVIGAIRGFRYGTHIKPGPIKREDLYHFVAIGPRIACGTIEGGKVKNQMENAADGSLNPDPRRWTGGWLFNFSGLTSDLYPVTGAAYNADGTTNGALNRARNIAIQNKNGTWSAWNSANKYTYCSYYYDTDTVDTTVYINRVAISPTFVPTVKLLTDSNGNALDGVEVVETYLNSLPNRTADTVLNRTTIKEPMPAYLTGSPEVQPWSGAF
jgi:2',3'-cyclic-nucleotide 2'-phosphodiesterase (5'-nucleotidase family)